MQACEQVMYLITNNIFILKLIGTLRFTTAPYLDSALEKTRPNHEIIIDMQEVKYIDSTILGSIVKFFLQDENKQKKGECWATIVCQNEDVKQTFNKIGFDKFFNIVKEDKRIIQPAENFIRVEERVEDEKKLENCVLHAHQTLNKLNPKDKDLKLIINSFKDK